MTLAQNVRAVRQAFGWSIQVTAEKTGVARGTIKNIETLRANPGASMMFRLANGFGLTFTDLIDTHLPGRLLPEPLSVVRYPDPEAVSLEVGRKIVAFRRRRQLGRVKFAKSCGVSRAMLFYIESGRMEPSLTLLERIAVGLQLSLGHLVEGHDSPVTAKGARHNVLSLLQANFVAEIARDGDTGGVQLVLTELSLPGKRRLAFPAGDAGSRVVLYVLDGRARLIGPAGEHNLNANEAIIVTADVALTIANRGEEHARIIHVAAAPPRWGEAEAHEKVNLPEEEHEAGAADEDVAHDTEDPSAGDQ